MTLDEYEKLPAAEQKFFMQCPDCREMFDLRTLEDIVLHLADHNPQLAAFRIDDSRFFSDHSETRQHELWRRLLAISKRRDAITTGTSQIASATARAAKAMSRQRIYQLRHKLAGLCWDCSRPAAFGTLFCELHRRKRNLENRKRQRKGPVLDDCQGARRSLAKPPAN
jgi:hypothetical protein